MTYVFDTGALIHLFRNYYPKRFPSLWERFWTAVDSGVVVSVREVLGEIERGDERARGVGQAAP